jgi:hypothetical protein
MTSSCSAMRNKMPLLTLSYNLIKLLGTFIIREKEAEMPKYYTPDGNGGFIERGGTGLYYVSDGDGGFIEKGGSDGGGIPDFLLYPLISLFFLMFYPVLICGVGFLLSQAMAGLIGAIPTFFLEFFLGTLGVTPMVVAVAVISQIAAMFLSIKTLMIVLSKEDYRTIYTFIFFTGAILGHLVVLLLLVLKLFTI